MASPAPSGGAGGGAGAGAGAGGGDSTAVNAAPSSPSKSTMVVPAGLQPLTIEVLKEVTGESELDNIVDFEAIFVRVERVANLEYTPSLRSFTLIDTGLQSTLGLAAAGRSLVRLCLTEQKLTRIEGLALPSLRDLQLHNNQITRIEGLEGCPRLQRLWLFGNKISVIEGLEGCCDLRELWLQDNKITRIANLKHLVNLQVLSLGANKITDFGDMKELQPLPALRSLSFYDVHFGTSPVTALDGYRDYVLCTLPQITELDGHEVSPRDRKAAHDSYLQKALEFSKRVEDLVQDTDKELLGIEARRQRNWLNSGAMRGELLATFGELESVVRDGRAAVLREQKRQQHVRDANLKALAMVLDETRREQNAWVDKRLAAERRAMAAEEKAFAALIARAEAEAECASHLAALTYRSRGAVVCQELSDHSPDFRFLSSHVNDCMQSQPLESSKSNRTRKPLRLLKAYKVFHRALERRFVTAGDSTETLRLFYGGRREALREVLEKGFVDTGDDSTEEPIVLFEDPWHAAAKAADRTPWKARHGGNVHGLLVCRVCPGNTMDVPGSSRKLPSDETIDKVARRIPSGYTAACISHDGARGDDEDGGGGGGKHGTQTRCYVLRPTQADRVLPEFYTLCSEIGADDVVLELGVSGNAARGIDSTQAALEAALADLTRPVSATKKATSGGKTAALLGGVDEEASAQLAQFQQRVSHAVAKHEDRVWREMDPATAAELADAEQEVRRLTQHLNALRGEIDAEKGLQERILREFRQQVGSGRSRKGRY